jgi:hypothetical protein
MTTPVEALSNLVVGTVESVSPNEVKVLLDLDAPHTTALNTGAPTAFPRINGYVLIPHESGATVAFVNWIGIDRSPYPKRSALKEFGLVDLPFPLRRMNVAPIGTLVHVDEAQRNNCGYKLARGVLAFPSVGDQVLVPTNDQLKAIVGSNLGDKSVSIGTSPMSADADIVVDPDKLFGRHLAVLGNTGSGKSCSVAGLIRWSLTSAKTAVSTSNSEAVPNARFIVLDPNGEYSKAFADWRPRVRLFRVAPTSGEERPLDVPAWLWNGHEWTAVAHAQSGVQRPLLLQGLRELKSGKTEGVPREAIIRRYLVSYATRLSAMLAEGTHTFAGSVAARFRCADILTSIHHDCQAFAEEMDQDHSEALSAIADRTDSILTTRKSGNYFNDFSVSDLEDIRGQLTTLAELLPELAELGTVSEDSPTHFDVNLLAEHLERIAAEQGGNVAAFISTLGLRIRGMLADPRLGSVIGREPPTSLEDWLEDYVGGKDASNGQIAVIDLSLVPSEIVHVVISVLGRLVFESLQRYRRNHIDGKPLPTVLVLEEAHAFIRKSFEDSGAAATPMQLCRETFERIAREGRKFGLGLVLASQRPSELSPTVLAQCNTFLLHRIVNDADQNLVSRLVPDNVSGLLKDLPSLPTKQAVLLGWASAIPLLVELHDLPQEHRPQSSDPDFWDVWTLRERREVNWKEICNQWVGSWNSDSPSEHS